MISEISLYRHANFIVISFCMESLMKNGNKGILNKKAFKL